MEYDPIFGFPNTDLETQEALVAEWLREYPAAAAVSDEEAEAFFSAAYVLRFMTPAMHGTVAGALGFRHPHGSDQKAIRRTTMQALRRWNQPRIRKALDFLVVNVALERRPPVALDPQAWTDEAFEAAAEEDLPLPLLAHFRRHLGKGDQIEAWVDTLGTYALRHYRFLLHCSRVTVRRLAFGDAPASAAASQAAAAVAVAAPTPALHELAQELATKNRASSLLRQKVRRLEQDRKRLRMENRRAELQAKAILAEARGEVEAARKALLEEQAGWARTLADQMRQFDLQAADLQREIAAARAAFIGSLAALAAGTGAARPLDGRTFTLPDPQPADSEACRLLAESLGAALVPAGGERLPGPAENLTDLERRLRQAALQDVLIKCDGLYRRKADRPGIAVSAFEVHARGQVICRGGNVTCSGRAAGSLMAEYGAAAMALRWLYAAGLAPGSRAEIWIDCRPLVLSLRRKHAGQRKRGCVQLDRAAKRLLHALHLRGCAVEIRWVPREEVYAVDRLCDLVYREAAWYHRRRNSVYNVPLRRFLRSARLHG